jgi:hypothetical protein
LLILAGEAAMIVPDLILKTCSQRPITGSTSPNKMDATRSALTICRRALVCGNEIYLKKTPVTNAQLEKKERNKPLRHQHSGRVTESSSHFSIIFFMNSSCHAK